MSHDRRIHTFPQELVLTNAIPLHIARVSIIHERRKKKLLELRSSALVIVRNPTTHACTPDRILAPLREARLTHIVRTSESYAAPKRT